LGRIVEVAEKKTIFTSPQHPYTEALLAAVPVPDPTIKRDNRLVEGDVPSPVNRPTGCHFNTRCPYAVERCRVEEPTLMPAKASPETLVACHLR
ncbi:MAG: oligopeptide/dipeptide ABC transporter ATP-binding protein, partial [Reyranellaceae bacterium]